MKKIFAIAVLFSTLSYAQDLSRGFLLRVMDGRNGRPVQNETIRLWYDEQQGSPILLRTGEDGTVQVPASPGPAVRVILSPTESVDCRVLKKDEPPVAYSLKSIQEAGVQAANRCGSPALRRRKGELVLFVRDRRWYDDGVNQSQ